MCARLNYQQLNSISNLKDLSAERFHAPHLTPLRITTEAIAMSKCGRILLGSFKTLAFLTLTAVTGLLGSVRAGAQTTQTPSSYNFGNVAILETSLPEKITVRNTGAASITINSYAVTGGPYAISTGNSTCADPGSLGAGATCTIAVTVAPTSLGTVPTGTLTINTTASNSPQEVTFSATGVEPVTLSSPSMAFGSIVVGATSGTMSVSLANNQPTSVTISAISVTPGNGFALAGGTTCSVNGQLTARSLCNIALTFTPGALGAAPASTLSVTTTQSGTPVSIPLNGTGITPTLISPPSIAFGNQALGQASLIKVFTLNNEQSTSLSISSIVAPAGGFAIDPSTNCPNPGSLPAHTTCNVGVTFTPTAIGPAPTGSVIVTTNASNSPQSVPLSGSGTTPVSFSGTSIAFGSSALNQTSSIKTITVTNNQTTQTVSFSTIALTGDSQFVLDPSTTCSTTTPLALAGAPGSSCTLAFTFTPTSTGSQPNGTTNVSFNATNAPVTVTLIGTGVQDTTVSPTSIAFGSVVVNTQSPTKTIKVNNLQAATLSLTQLVFNGPFSLDTSSNTTCPMAGGTVSGTLAANSSCVIGIIFTPTAAGSASGGQVTVISSSPSGPMAVSLAGTGETAVTFSPTSLHFGNVPINIATSPINITVSNNQSANLDFTSITVPAPFSIFAGTTTCIPGTPVLPGKNCVVSVSVDPTVIGSVPASSITLNDDAPSSPQTATLAATAVPQVQVNPSTIAFGSLVVGQQNTATTTVTNYLSTPILIDSVASFTAPYKLDTTVLTTCPLAPEALGAGLSCKITVDATPTTTGSLPGSATLIYNVSGNSTMVDVPITLAGFSYEPVAIYPSPASFPTSFVGVASAIVPVKIKNLQNTALTISAITVGGTDPGDFSIQSNLCPTTPATLAANSSCIVNMIFTPAASGGRTATLSVTDNALGSPQSITLTGDGNAPLKISPLSIISYQANVGVISAYQTVMIANQTTNAIVLNAFELSGDFQQTATTCGASLPYSLPGGSSCNVTISFAPTIGGTRGGQLQVVDTAATSPQVINLQGHAYNPLTLSQPAMVYSAQLVNTTSTPAKVMTLTNHENESESFSLTPSGPFSATTNCTTGTIAANSSCTLYVNYSPTTTTPATQSGSITVNDSAPGGSPLVLSLTGTATATNPAPAVAVVSPGAAAGGTVLNVTITGNGWTHFSNSSVVSFVDTDSATYASDITVNSVTATSPNVINANLTLAASPVYGARNIKVVTPLAAGGNETATLNSAFIISDPTQTFEITSITPGVGTQGQGYLGVPPLTVNIVATGTSFVQGTTFANFGDGVTVESLDITSATTATAVLAISNTTDVGYRTLTMVTGGQVANSVLNDGNPLFYIGPNSATLTAVTMATVTAGNVTCTSTPVSVAQSFAGPVCLTATGSHFLQNATGITVTGGVTVGDTIVTSPTTAYSNVIVPANATIGVDSVTVATGGEISTLSNSFQVTGSTPGLLSVSPNSGQQGQSLTVTVTGNTFTAFNACPGGVLTADFTGVISSPTVNIVGAHEVTIPIVINENAPTGGITANLTCGGAGSATIFPFGFTIKPSSAAIVSVTPSSVPQGGQVTLNVTGSNTDWSQANTMSAFYPTPIATPLVNETTILSQTSAQLAISVPTNTPVGTYCFYMATGGQIVSACIQVYANTPTLTMSPANGLLPVSGTIPISVSFTGQFTHFSQSGTVPVVSGEGVTLTNFTVNNPDGAMGTINISAGAAPGTRLITFTTGGEIVTTYFNVTTIPVYIVNISPWNGPQSKTMNVAIEGLNTHFVSGSTQVIFGGPQITVNSVTVTNATHLTANITTSYTPPGLSLTPTPPGWNTVYVNDPTEQLLTGFLVDAPATPSLVSACVTADLPTCVSSAPQGSGGTNITITGSLTNWVQGSSELVMGAGITVADLVITSPTTATATISVSPTAPVGGNSVIMITPVTGGGFEYDSGSGFSVTPSAAYISDVSLPACQNNTDANFVADFCNNGTSNIVPVVSQLQTSNLNITGVGTHWLQGETTFSFGPGVVLDQTTIIDPTHANVEITVLSTSPVGFATATASTDGENASLVQAIDIEEGSPTFLAFSPQGAQQGATLNVEVLGRFTNWSTATPPIAEFNQDISINSLTVVDSETLVLNVTVSPWAYVDYSTPCGHVLTITSGSEQVSSSMINDNFCVSAGAQEITGVAPNASPQGSSLQVTITGSQTNFLAGQSQVSFGDPGITAGVPTMVTNTTMVVPVTVSTSATSGYHTVTVTTYGQIENQVDAFSVTPSVAQLTEAIPDQAEQGVQNLAVRLIGQYSHFSASSTATFGAGITVVGTPTFVSATEIDAVIDISPISYVGSRVVTVSTPNVTCPAAGTVLDANVTYQGCPNTTTGKGTEIVNNTVFSIIPGPAIITTVSPNTGNEGQEVVFNITGLDTHWQQNFTQFYIAGGGSDITVNDVIINSATSATVDISISQTANAGPRSVYMVTAGESLTDSGAFVVTGGVPAISYLTPNSAQPGTSELQVTVVGNAYTQWSTAGGTTVSFGPGITIDTQEVTDASHIVADITVGPTCTSPNVPVGCAQYGYRTVVVQTGTQGLTGNFDVVAPPPPPTPYVWYESPSSGIPGQTVSVYFYGANTEWNPNPTAGTTLTGWNADYITVNSYQIVSPTEALVNITINPNAPAETMGLTFTTNGTTYNDGCSGCEVDDASFTVVIAQPVLSIVDPGSGLQGAQNITVNVLGQFTAFDATTTFTIGSPGSGITVNSVHVISPTVAEVNLSIGQETPTGGYSVVATTPDAPAIAQVVSGAGFSVTPSLATILSVSPNTSPQGTLITVNVTGFDTHWSPATTFSFGAGIVVTNVTVTGETSATLSLAIPALAPEGTTSATATTSGEVATLNQAFVITAGTPYLLSSGPGSVEQQGAAVFTILAQATTWSSAAPPVVSYGGDITLGPVQVTSPTTLTVQGAASATAYPGYRNLTVTTGTQVLSIGNAVYISPGPAVINSVTPNTGGQGVTFSSVQINGINTHWQQGVTTLTFPGVLVNSFTVNSPTSITASIVVNTTTNPGQVNVTATTLGEVATEVNAFTITQTQAELAFINPSSLPQGQTQNLSITGIDTNFASGTSVVSSTNSGITINSATVNSATSITANVTVSPVTLLGYKNITVTTGAQIVASNSLFQATSGPAAISGINPTDGGEGQSVQVSVNGSQTHFAQGLTTASFSGGISVTGVTVQSLTQATVNIYIPVYVALGTYNVTLTTGGEVATILNGFTVNTGSPVIANVNPPTGTQGLTTNVALTGGFTSWVQGTSVASFGSGITVNPPLTVNSPTSAIANITISPTATLGSRTVTVTTNSQTASITGGFTVLAGAPTLVTSTPGSGQAGATLNLVITGDFTNFQQAFSTVSLGDGITTNFITVNSPTQITANITIPGNAATGSTYVSVTTLGSTITLDDAFTVLPGTPVITQINPNVGTQGQTDENVTIIGLYTNWVNGTTVASFGGPSTGITVNSTTVNSATNLTVNISISGTAPLGPVTVTTTTHSEIENVAGGFTIQSATPPSPQVISLSPGASAGGMPLNSVINAVFSEPMMRSTISSSTVLLTLTSNPGGNVSVAGTVTLDPTGRIVTFAPSSLLAPNSTYYFNMNGSIESATGIPFSNYAVDLYTTSATATTAPTVVAFNPPASSTVGTNVLPQLEFSADMQQGTETGMTVSTGGNPVAGTFSWNANPNCCGSGWAGPGTVLTFTPTAALAAGTTYKVAWNNTLTDTAGNPVVPGSFTFTTGSGPDTVTNNVGANFNGLTNVGTNFAPTITYSKAINPIDIWGGWNSGTLLLYNSDSDKYIEGTVTVAPNGLSATFTPTVPLLPDTYYRLYMAGGDYDADGNYLNGLNAYFTTGAGSDTTKPTVTFVSPANSATSVPLNSQIMVKFSTPINDNNINVIKVTPSGGSAITGTASLAGDLVTLTFVPNSPLNPGKVYTVAVSGYTDVVGNIGTPFTSTFTAAASSVLLNLSTGLNSGGEVITPVANCGGASPEPACPADANWTVVPTGTSEALGLYVANALSAPPASGPAQPLYVVGSADGGWYGGWPPNGPLSDSININPSSTTGNTFGVYSTTFNIPSPVPSNLCLVGYMGVDDNGSLGIVNSANPTGIPITGNINAIYGFANLNVPISSFLVAGSNTLALGWGSTDNNDEMFRLQAVIETCGASVAPGGLSITSATPANNATNIATNTSIVMNFNNAVDPATVNATTLPIFDSWNSNYQIAGNYVLSNSNTTVTFTPASPFPVNSNIWVGACYGPLDLAGDTLTSGCWTQEINFWTGPTVTAAGTGLQVSATSPLANATNVGLRAPVFVTFNRSINPYSITNGDFGLYDGEGVSSGYSQNAPWCDTNSWTHSQDDTTFYWNCYPLPSSAEMTMALNSGISDVQGETLAPYTSSFTTSPYDSNTNGAIIGTRPGDAVSGVNPNLPLVLFSNLPINASTANAGIQVAQNNVIVPGTATVLDGGYTLEFTPSVPFTSGALIQWWTTGNLFDTTYNTPITGISGYYYTAGSTSTAVPAMQVSSPPAYTNPVPTNTVFDVQFNTPINPSTIVISGTPSIYLYDSTVGSNVPVTYSQPQPNEVLMTPTTLPLPSNHYIYVEITTGLQSTTSVPAAADNWWEYTGTTTDTTLPIVTSAVPYNGATNVAVNDTPGVIFSKTVDPISVNSATFQVLKSGTPLPGYFWFNSTDTRVDFVPNTPLPTSASLTISINGVTDREGHPVTFSSSFVTGTLTDFTAPSVLFSSVNSNDSIPTNSTITVTFSEPMDATTFANGQPGACGNFYIYDELSGDGLNCIATTLTWNSSQTIAYLTPASPLAAGRGYQFVVENGTDLAGNAMNADSFNFYADFTGSSSAPTVTAFNPIGGLKGLGTNAVIEAQFSAPIDPNYLSGVTLTYSGGLVPANVYAEDGNTVVQIIPTAPLLPNTTYTMNIAGVQDPVENVVATVTNSFTTGATYDINLPTVVESAPVNGASVGINVDPKLVFNKPLNPLTVNASSFRLYLYDSGEWIPSTVTLSPNGLEVTITPQIALLPNTEYYFSGGFGNPYDEDGNYYPESNYFFTTTGGTDITAPTVSISPANTSTGVPVNAVVQVAVSVPVDPTTITQSSITLKHGSTPVTGTVTLSNAQLLVFTPSTTATSPAQTSLGCYNDNQNNIRVLTGYSWSSGNEMTVEQCVSSCGSRGYQYAAVEDASQCFCGNNNYSEQGTSTSCNMACTGNGAETCGGSGAQNVYTAQSEVVPQNLAASTAYTVNVSGFSDANGNTVTPATSSFTTAASASSSDLVISSANVNITGTASTGVSSTLPLTIVFSNPLDPATVNSNTIRISVGGCCSQNVAGTYALSNNNMTVTFTPTSGYPVQWYNPPTDTSEVPIYVSTCYGPYDVLGQEAYGNSCSNNLFYFYVNPGATYTKPLQVTGVTPPDLSTNVGRDQSVSVTFNNSLQSGSAGGYNSQLYAGQSIQVDGSYSLSADNKTLTFNVGALNNNTNYTILLPSGGVADMWGNTLAQDYVSTFSTMADPATGNGRVIGTTPSTSTSSSVPVNSLLTLYLNRQVNSATLPGQLTVTVNGQVYAGTVQADASGYQVQYTPSVPFPDSATVQWFFSGNVLDTYGDYFSGDSGYFYTAAAVNAATAQPVVVTESPTCCNLQDVATNAEVDVQFSQPLNPATVTTANFYQNTGPAITYTVGLVPNTNNTVVRIKPSSNFTASTQYGFCTNSSVLGANGVAAESDCNLTYFTTTAATDTTSGTVTVGPPDNSQNVGTNAYIRVQFSKPADRTTVNSSTIAITTGGNAIPGSFTYNYNGDDLYGVDFYPLNPLPQSSTIKIAVSGILDYAGNEFSEPTITFQTAAQPDFTNPSVTLDFGSTTYGVGTNASFTCLYSEPMDPSSITPSFPYGTYIYSETANAEVPMTYTFAPDMMSVTMTPVSPLLQNSYYYYECYSAIDLTGNAENGNYSYFYTGSGPVTTGPAVVGTNPPNGMTNVPINTQTGPWVNSSLGILFSEAVNADTLGQITLTPQGGSPIPIGVTPEDGNYMVWVSLPYPLAPNTQYTFNITGVTDINGNPMSAPATSTFTTGAGFDWNNASVTATSPANGVTTTGVPTSVSVTFSEALAPILINTNEIYVRNHNTPSQIIPATISVSSSATPATPTTITLNLTAPLADMTIYDIYYYPNPWWLTNISGIAATNNYGILASFTTGTAGAVNGVCGSANTGTFTSVASINPANLCSVGTVSGQTNNGTYSWTCNGDYGGTNASCSATITPASSCLAKPTGLVSWWPGNDNATDIISGNNGTLENGVTYGLGEVDDAFNLTGNTAQNSDQYIEINGGTMPANLEIQGNLTLSAWIYPTAYPVNYGSGAIGIIAGSQYDGSYSGATLYFDARVNPDGNDNVPIGHIAFNLGNGSTWYVQDTQTQVPLNQWTLVTGVATSGQQSQVYFNGVLQPSNSGNYTEVWPGTVSYTNTWFQIGQETNENRPFTGLIDEVQVYNTSLTAAQILAIYNKGNAGMCP
jgi:hypothetical protein